MSLSGWFLILLLVLFLPLIRCCCSFFSICHFSYLYLQFSYPYMSHFLFVNFPVIRPRHDKLTVIYLLFSKFNLSQTLEFDNSWKLMTTRNFPYSFRYCPRQKNLLLPFFLFFCFTIIPDNSNISILTLVCLSLFLTIGDLSFLILISWMPVQ